jgi:hypothetical protein
MARGRARPGAGRPKGTAGIKKVTVQRLKRQAEQSIGRGVGRLKRVRAIIFDGDAHAFLVSVYRNAAIELDPRIKAAGLALPYELDTERPREPFLHQPRQWAVPGLHLSLAFGSAEG